MANDKRYINQNRHIIGGNTMKLRKRLTAIGATLVMAVSMMSIGASADNWSLYSNPNGPYSENVFNQQKTFYPGGGTIHGVNESCSYYYSNSDSYGNVGYARYWGYTQDLYGNNQSFGSFSNHYHYGTVTTHYIPLTSSISTGYKLIVKYQLNNTHVYSSMNGIINKS